MKLTLDDPRELAAVAAQLARLLGKPAVPVLGGVLLQATEDGLTATGYDYDTLLSRTLPATVHTPGEMLVSARLLAEIAKVLPRREVNLSATAEALEVSCGPVQSTLPLLPREDYPELPAFPAPVAEVDAAALARATSSIGHATGKPGDPSQEVTQLPGAHLYLPADGPVQMYATDRYRLALHDVPTVRVDDEPAERWVRVAHAPLHELARAARGTVQLALDDRVLALISDRERVLVRQLQLTKPLPVGGILSRLGSAVSTLPLAELAETISRAALYSQVVVELDEYQMTVQALSRDNGSRMSESVALDYDGPPVRFGLNPTYLNAALATIDTDLVAFTGPVSPVQPLRVVPVADDGTPRTDHQQVVMTMKIPEPVAT